MSEQGPDPEEMQFDRADYAEGTAEGPACRVCQGPIEGEYYEINGAVLCAPCRERVGAAVTGGSGPARLLKATLFGTVAAVAGFALYFGVSKLTGYQLGLISIVVGLMVGGAVRKGSENRGGWVYQLLAMFLVYSAIAASYSATILPALIERSAERKADAEKADAKETEQAADVTKTKGEDPKAADAKGPAPADAPKDAEAPNPVKVAEKADKALEPEEERPSGASIAVGLLLFIGLLYALPILANTESIIGLLLIGFALWEAWKMNRKVPIVFKGPFRIGNVRPSIAGNGDEAAHV